MMNPEIRDQAYQFFIEEASELLQTIETGLLTLQEDRAPAKVHEIMRAAHSLKGGAASVGLDAIRDLSHRLEDFFRALYREEVILDTELESLLLQGFDCLKNPLLAQIERGEHDPDGSIVLAEPIFALLQERLGAAMDASAEYLPSSADLGIDIVASIFEIDVATELERLAAIAGEDIAQELGATIEIFTGFSEMLGLPGFGEIGLVAAEKLSQYPDQAANIAPIVLENWHRARYLVLDGDRTSGGSPSPELLAFGSDSIEAEFSWSTEEFTTTDDTAFLPIEEVFSQSTETLIPLDDTAFLQQAYQFFLEEAQELLPVIETGLLSLGREPSPGAIHELMRAAHSIKGGAASVGLETICTLASHLENYFKALSHPDIAFTDELEGDLLAGFEYLKQPLIARQQTQAFDEAEALEKATAVFTRIEEQLGDALHQTEEYLPSSTDLGIDIVASIFEIDVAAGLADLETAIAGNDRTHLITTLQTTLEVFEGFAQMLNLLGFAEICAATRRAITHHPEQLPEIATLALEDFRQGQEQVLAGDRTTGGNPSPELSILSFPAPDRNEAAIVTALEEVFQLDAPAPIPSLDELFGDEMTAETALETPSLEDIFTLSPEAEFEAMPEPFESFSPTEEPLVIPELSLEEIFGVAERSAIEADLDRATEAILRDFEQLPTLDSIPQLDNFVKKKPEIEEIQVKPRSRSEETKPNPASLTVRVDFNRLERMNNLVGELSINRNSLSLQNEQLQAAVKEMLERFERFERMTNGIRELSDRMLFAGESLLSGNAVTAESDTDIRFDTLEMDRYGHLHSRLQELLEEMMQLGESVDDIVLFARGSNQTLESQRQMLTNLRDELMWARMLPLGEVLNRFPRVLRDLSNSYHKSVRLKLLGTGVLVDKAALEKLYDPLLHLLRNAFDHGIEPPAERQKSGKSTEGQIEIRAYHQGNQTVIEIRDDGRGLNLERIREKAIATGLMTAEQLSLLSRDKLAELIFEPGFSTAETVSELSGRGVGLDVVRDQVRSLKGTVTVTSSGQGTIFSIRLPLTLTIAKLLVCTVNPDGDRSRATAVALPSDAIEEIIIPQDDQIKRSGEQRFCYFAGQIVPIYRLANLLEYRCSLPETFSRKSLTATVPSPEDWNLPLLILRRGQEMFAIEVDRLVTEQELVIKPFGNAITPPPYTYGCTILSDGTLIPVVNGSILLEYHEEATSPLAGGAIPALAVESVPVPSVSTILIVDDSAALRRTLALTLQKAGYRVLQAKDGREALERLEQTQEVQLIVCDVEMPNMNGFEFLGQRRKSRDLMAIPVAMLTSRGSDKHRQLATHLGASAYFTKPYIEQQFLRAIGDLISCPMMVNYG
jgi:two-component system, chemotaxis family, sensor histidine kinase and response regulator PixL